MRYLALETVAMKPHLETCGEICLRALDEGVQVGYAWLGYDLYWSEWELPKFSRFLGCSLERRQTKFSQLLEFRGVDVLHSRDDERRWQTISRAWADQFFGDLDTLRAYKFDNQDLGLGAASSLISFTKNSKYAPESNLELTRACLSSTLLVYFRALKKIRDYGPDVVVTFNGRFATSRAIVCAANANGIEVIRHERGHKYNHYETYKHSIHDFQLIEQRIKKAWVSSQSTCKVELAKKFFEQKRNGDTLGWYSFTKNQTRGLIPSFNPYRRRVVYFTNSEDEYAAIAEVSQDTYWCNQINAVKKLIEVSRKILDLDVVIRVHPNTASKSKSDSVIWKKFCGPGVLVIGPEDKTDSYALLDTATIVAVYHSSIGIEAVYWGKPCIVFGSTSYDGLGAVYKPKDSNHLQMLLSETPSPEPFPADTALPYGFYYMSFGFEYKYYNPVSLTEGKFLGQRLGWDPLFVYILRKLRLHKLVFWILTNFKTRRVQGGSAILR